MKKKSLISMVVALSLTATVMVGATLAYLTSETDKVTNTFTIGKVEIELDEPSWNPDDAKDLTPGATVPKDPKVENTGDNDAYIAVTVDGMADMAAAGFSAAVDTENWVKVDAKGNVVADWDGALEDGIYAYNVGALTVKGETPALFSEVKFDGLSSTTLYQIEEVAVDTEDEEAGTYFVIHEFVEVNEEGENVYSEEVLNGKEFATEKAARNYIDSMTDYSEVTFDLNVKAYAIQSDNLDFTTEGVYTWVEEIGLAE